MVKHLVRFVRITSVKIPAKYRFMGSIIAITERKAWIFIPHESAVYGNAVLHLGMAITPYSISGWIVRSRSHPYLIPDICSIQCLLQRREGKSELGGDIFMAKKGLVFQQYMEAFKLAVVQLYVEKSTSP
jgi:hypothetical protein